MPLTVEQQKEIDEALEKEVNEIDYMGDDYEKEEEIVGKEKEKEEEVIVKKEDEVIKGEEVVKKEDKEGVVVKKEEEPVDDISELRKLINAQNAEILSLKSNSQVQSKSEEKVETKVKVSDKIPAEIPKAEEYQSVDYIGDLDMDDVTADKKVLNQIINKAVKDAVEIAKKNIPDVSNTLSNLPDTIKSQIRQQRIIDETVGNFYKENEDLALVKETVSQVARNIAAEHKDLTLEQLFNKAAETTRTLLRMPTPEKLKKKKEEDSEFENPAFAAKNSNRQTPKRVSNLQAEIDEL